MLDSRNKLAGRPSRMSQRCNGCSRSPVLQWSENFALPLTQISRSAAVDSDAAGSRALLAEGTLDAESTQSARASFHVDRKDSASPARESHGREHELECRSRIGLGHWAWWSVGVERLASR